MISQEDIDRGVFGPNAVLFKHPLRDPQRGFEISGGSLGMGLGYAAGLGLSLRRKDLPMSLSEETTMEDADFVVDQLKEIIPRLRSMSPLYADFIAENK